MKELQEIKQMLEILDRRLCSLEGQRPPQGLQTFWDSHKELLFELESDGTVRLTNGTHLELELSVDAQDFLAEKLAEAAVRRAAHASSRK